MSSDHFSDKPLPSGKKRCAKCGKVTSSAAQVCLLCREMDSVQSEALPHHAMSALAAHEQKGTVILGVLALLSCGAMAFGTWRALLVLLILAALALFRTVVFFREQTAPPSKLTVVGNFLGSFGLMALFGLSMVPFFAGVFCTLSLYTTLDRDWIMPVSVGASLVPGFFVGIGLLFRLFRVKKG